ncbi:MAG: type II secretion system protein [Minisyncoccia bacterium]
MRKGFTLLELLIVIGILAILSTTMLLVINPAEMLKKARDSQRMSDLNTLKSAIALYLTDVNNPNIGDSAKAYAYGVAPTCGGRTGVNGTSQVITGSGWIPINFASISGGSPISAEPIDPNPVYTGTSMRYYTFLPFSDNTFELIANMESAYYSTNGSGDVESTDGGNVPGLYEVGTRLSATVTASSTCYGTAP